MVPRLSRVTSHGVTLLGDQDRSGGVTLAFTERTGGVSTGCYGSLNLGDACGDDPSCVEENRRRALAALGCAALEGRLVNPVQVHGDTVVLVRDESDAAVAAAQAEARAGADAVVCTAAHVPVLLCYADCVPVILACAGGFAVVHSGWKGTIARISAKALRALCEVTAVQAQDVRAYVGPRIGGADYEVSAELLARFVAEFGEGVSCGERRLDLGEAVLRALAEAGVAPENVAVCDVSTARATERFYSYRAEGGSCGRHGALAVLLGDGTGETNTFEAAAHTYGPAQGEIRPTRGTFPLVGPAECEQQSFEGYRKTRFYVLGTGETLSSIQ